MCITHRAALVQNWSDGKNNCQHETTYNNNTRVSTRMHEHWNDFTQNPFLSLIDLNLFMDTLFNFIILNRSAKMSPDNHANLFQNNLAKMLPEQFMNKNVSMSQNKNVPRFQDVYVPQFKLENVSTYQNRNVSMFPDKIAGMFQNKNAKMFLGKFVKTNVWIPGGVNNVPMVKHLMLPLHLALL